MEIVLDIYKITESLPSEEKFGLVSQMRRCAVSIPSNIAEGAARKSNKEFINFLYISQGSLSELDTQLELATLLNFIPHEIQKELDNKMIQVDKMLSGLIKSQRNQ